MKHAPLAPYPGWTGPLGWRFPSFASFPVGEQACKGVQFADLGVALE